MNPNYFDILGLKSDSQGKDIKAAIDDKENGVKRLANNQDLRGDDLLKAQQEIADMRAWAENKDLVKAHRDDFIATQSKALRGYFSSLPNHYEAYRREVESWVGRYRLAMKEVEKIMKEDPNHEVLLVKAKDLPPNFVTGKRKSIQDNIELLNKTTALAKICPWHANVHDLYDFVAGFSGNSVADVKKMDTAEIFQLISSNKDRFIQASGGNSGDLGKPLRGLFPLAGEVFDPKKPENRAIYENTIVYESLRPVFQTIKEAPLEMRKEDSFVKNYLKLIKEKYDDEELAITIYNVEAGLKNDPWEPTKVIVSMRCGNCGSITNFPTHEAARHGKCSVCGAAFYSKCPSCGQEIPSSATICPHCNFNIAELTRAPKYYTEMKGALARGDISAAHLQLEQLLLADPKKMQIKNWPDFESIRKKIEEGYAQYAKYFTSLTSLIAGKSFYKAKEEAERIKKQNPALDLSAHLKKIVEALDKVKAMMPSLSDTSEAAAVRCYEVLDVCTDYSPAIEHIHKVPLAPPANFQVVAMQGATFGVSISFAPSKQTRVMYYLVRNEEHPPRSYTDGTILLKESLNTVYEDTKAQPGKAYYYAAFVCREGVFSPPASARFALYAEVEKLEAMPQGQKATISFSLPLNATGARIIRKENAVPQSENDPGASVVCASTRLAYEDKGVQLDHQYGYLVQAIYSENNRPVYSKGKGVTVKIERDPSDIANFVISKVGATIQVRYQASDQTSPNPVKIYSINPALVKNRLHNLLPAKEVQDILKNERLLASGKASDGGFAFTIAGDYSYNVVLVSMTEAKARFCGLGEISSIPLLEADPRKTQVKEGSRAYVKLKECPANCFGIHYLALEAGHSKTEITDEDISRHQSGFISKDAYFREGIIDVRGRAVGSGSFKLLLRGEFVLNGQHVYGKSTSINISSGGPRTIGYKFEWSKKGLFKKTYSGTLIIECKGQLPPLTLMGKEMGTPKGVSDYEATKVFDIEEGMPGMTHVMNNYSIPMPPEACIPEMNYRLFLSSPGEDIKITASDYGTLKCPK